MNVGRTVSKEAPEIDARSGGRAFFRFFFLASSSSVQLPFGPRKSGSPALVDTPAPVRTTTRSAARTMSMSCASLASSTAGASSVSGSPVTPLCL